MDLEDDNSPVGEVNRHKFYGKSKSPLSIFVLRVMAIVPGESYLGQRDLLENRNRCKRLKFFCQ